MRRSSVTSPTAPPASCAAATGSSCGCPPAGDAGLEEAEIERFARAAAASLTPLFRPRSIAVVGASRDPRSARRRRLPGPRRASGFPGPVYAVNRSAAEVAGRRAYAAPGLLPEPADLVVVAVPAAAVTAVARDAAAHGARALVVLARPGSRSRAPGRGAARPTSCTWSAPAGLRPRAPTASGSPSTTRRPPSTPPSRPAGRGPGRVAFASQSGGLGIGAPGRRRRAWASASRPSSAWATRPTSRLERPAGLVGAGSRARGRSLLYLEGFGNPRRFARLARRVARTTPIVALKAGRGGRPGGAAAGSHTAALAAGEAPDRRAVRAGRDRPGSTPCEELFAVGQILADQPRPGGDRLAILSNAGGPAILAADAAEAGRRASARLPGRLLRRLAGRSRRSWPGTVEPRRPGRRRQARDHPRRRAGDPRDGRGRRAPGHPHAHRPAAIRPRWPPPSRRSRTAAGRSSAACWAGGRTRRPGRGRGRSLAGLPGERRAGAGPGAARDRRPGPSPIRPPALGRRSTRPRRATRSESAAPGRLARPGGGGGPPRRVRRCRSRRASSCHRTARPPPRPRPPIGAPVVVKLVSDEVLPQERRGRRGAGRRLAQAAAEAYRRIGERLAGRPDRGHGRRARPGDGRAGARPHRRARSPTRSSVRSCWSGIGGVEAELWADRSLALAPVGPDDGRRALAAPAGRSLLSRLAGRRRPPTAPRWSTRRCGSPARRRPAAPGRARLQPRARSAGGGVVALDARARRAANGAAGERGVVIAGGGIAGLEAALALRALVPRRPGPPARRRRPLRPAARGHGARLPVRPPRQRTAGAACWRTPASSSSRGRSAAVDTAAPRAGARGRRRAPLRPPGDRRRRPAGALPRRRCPHLPGPGGRGPVRSLLGRLVDAAAAGVRTATRVRRAARRRAGRSRPTSWPC